MKLTALSIALIAALGMTAGCSTQTTIDQASHPAASRDAEAQYALGRYYQGQQRYELAVEAYRRALAVNPAHVSAHNGLGASLLLAGRNAEAIEQFKAGLQHQPRSAALWNNLGYAYTLIGENKLAEFALKQSLDLDPADIKTNINLAMAQQGSAQAMPAPAATTLASAQADTAQTGPAQIIAAPVIATPPITNPAAPAQATPAELAMKLRPSTVLAEAVITPATIHIVEAAPRVYEMNLPGATAASPIAASASMPAPVAGVTRISIPLREAVVQTASLNSDDFVLEIRNGNGVRRMAWRTSQYLAGQGYATKRLTNQPGFNVATTRIFYLPGYLAEATQLLAHLPKDTMLTETSKLRHGTHLRVVLGRDMVQHQAGLDAASPKTHLAALQH